MRYVAVLAVTVFSLHAQVRFDVASVKPADSGGGRGSQTGGPGTADPTRISVERTYLKTLLARAWDVGIDQISGPAWLDSERYTIAAKIPAGATKEQFRLMLQNLLAERFALSLHHESKQLPGYELVVAKNGPKLKLSVVDPNAPEPPLARPGDLWDLPADKDGFPVLTGRKGAASRVVGGRVLETYSRYTSADLTALLSMRLGTPISANRFAPGRVEDKTGLTRRYDFHLEYERDSPDTQPDGAGYVAMTLDSNFLNAVEKQLGLKVQQRKIPVDVVVIDRAEKVPTEN